MSALGFALVLTGAPMVAQQPASADQQVVSVAQYSVADAICEIRTRHLDSVEGRVHFLVNQVRPFTARAGVLNQEVQDLFRQIKDPANQSRIVEIGQTLEHKMAVLGPMLPILQESLHLDGDFQHIDEVLQKKLPLESSEAEMLLRVARIANYVAKMDLNAADNP
ncbi:MAG TPA: hypothetical protein VHL30_01225 [Chlamydiales bacterium]|jgi:hypothetical protein|nr:hypothetical protein [Chlamydiales bacterium]